MTTKVLLLVGGPDYHDTPETRASMYGLLDKAFDVTMSDDLADLNPDTLAGYDAVVNFTTFLEPSDDQIDALLSAVEGGLGFVGIHGATATFWNQPRYLEMIGGKFIVHDELKRFTVNIGTAREVEAHPITADMDDFAIEDELYIIEGDLTQWHILARAEGHPIIYTKTWGQGRVYSNALGHDTRALENPSFQELVRRGVAWVAGEL
ncbi:MAG: ThuA domain-containing protein [Anaerolineae bacterium]|nr:ThuA domain-containing protein [Anaerolineae bacterium]